MTERKTKSNVESQTNEPVYNELRASDAHNVEEGDTVWVEAKAYPDREVEEAADRRLYDEYESSVIDVSASNEPTMLNLDLANGDEITISRTRTVLYRGLDAYENDGGDRIRVRVKLDDDEPEVLTDGGVDVREDDEHILARLAREGGEHKMRIAETYEPNTIGYVDGEAINILAQTKTVGEGSGQERRTYVSGPYQIDHYIRSTTGGIKHYVEVETRRESDGDEPVVVTDGGEVIEDEEQTVYVVVHDLETHANQGFGAAVEGVYTSREDAEAHVEEIESGWTDELAEVVERTVEDGYEGGGRGTPKGRLMTDGGIPSPIRSEGEITERSLDMWGDDIESDVECEAIIDLQVWLQEIDLAAVYDEDNVALEEDGYVIVAEEEIWNIIFDDHQNRGVFGEQTLRAAVETATEYHHDVLKSTVGREDAARLSGQQDVGVVFIKEGDTDGR